MADGYRKLFALVEAATHYGSGVCPARFIGDFNDVPAWRFCGRPLREAAASRVPIFIAGEAGGDTRREGGGLLGVHIDMQRHVFGSG